MLLEKVDTFDKAMAVLLSEEQANLDSKQCTSTSSDGATFATSAYKKNQTQERQNFSSNNEDHPIGVPGKDYKCIRCCLPGHWVQRCRAQHTNCEACGKMGHTAKACNTRNWNSVPTVAQAHSVKAYIDRVRLNHQT